MQMHGEPISESYNSCLADRYEVDSMPFTDCEEQDSEGELRKPSSQTSTSTAWKNPLPVKNLILTQATISPVTPKQEQGNREL